MHSESATHYERAAETRWGKYITGIERRAILAAHRYFGNPSVALEVGAAGGRWSKLLTDSGWRMVCTDINEGSIALCQARLPNATCIVVKESDERLPGDAESVDLILCIGVFAVMPTDWFLAEAARLLRPNGLLVGEFANKCSVRGYLKHMAYLAKGRKGLEYYAKCYGEWKINLNRNGFDIVSEEGLCWFPFSHSSDSRFVRLFVMAERWMGLHRIPNLSPWVVFSAKKGTNSCRSLLR